MADVDPAARKKRTARARRADSEPIQSDTPDPIEIAMKAVAAGAVPGSAAQVVLERHAGLIEIQCKREREELANVRVQRITRWLILSAVAALLAAVVALIWNASRSESLVVEPFRVPPALSSAGIGGEVMATRVMDQVALMQSRTLSTRPAESYSTDWGGDINVAIPSTGATVGDLRRLLRSWFGKETRISGEVVRVGDTWSVTARVTGENAVSAAGPQLEPLVTRVAEQVFRQTQPYRYVVFLLGSDRREEALAAARELALNGPEKERPWGLVAYANSLGGPGVGQRERLPALQRAAEALPDFPMPHGNYAAALEDLGLWEQAVSAHRRAAVLIGDGSRISEEFRAQYLAGKPAWTHLLTGDFGAAATALEAAGAVGTPTYAQNYVSSAIAARYLQRDTRSGDRNLARLNELQGFSRDTNAVAALGMETLDEAQRYQLAFRTLARIVRLRALEDGRGMKRELPAHFQLLFSLVGDPKTTTGRNRDIGRIIWPTVAPELARIGKVTEAEALLAPLELDCYPCLLARGEVAAAKGDHTGARRWVAEAARQGPSLPFAHDALGRVLAAAGDGTGAEAAFAEAVRIQPRWADPFKHHGDVVARVGQHEKAARLYEKAARHAPRWGALHIAWGQVLWRAGKHEEARARFRAAAGMDLSPADRTRLQRFLAATSA